ncbi:hypothetical protein [Streptomyces purpureus]|uniref:ATP-binding protein n=1 Tax=Streptomyces purpureus TaxID=1951 RepID=A0A918HDW1_9ACTN|nr:hypothetical protein [Streptomyces purpureus]GGT57472.1 hypothetical protein GCM10014713_58870 [Streptomyces purpureus]
MKQSAAKTLGVAALGAAFAATAAGTANAASLPDVTSTLGGVTQNLPVAGDVLEKLPAGAPESLLAGKSALDSGTQALPGAVGQLAESAPQTIANSPVKQLIGGLPVNGLASTGLNGLALGN